ncbi:hypothetical protein C8J57DRAFT_1221106 [Mycena rebaudengoi]|nr:hypothetical protein C8J57DRAFT_1221106 [Mycena rebaudengoi]
MFSGERRSVLLLIEDTRRRIHEKIAQPVKVAVINSANASGAIESTASSREIIGALQTSISAFQGPARIGAPNPENPSYTEFFATIAGFEYLESDIHTDARLIIPANSTLNLTLAAIGGAKIPEKSESPDVFDELLDWAKNKSEAMLDPPSTSVRTKRKVTINASFFVYLAMPPPKVWALTLPSVTLQSINCS